MDPTTDNIYTWYNSGGWGQFYLYRTQKKKKKKKKRTTTKLSKKTVMDAINRMKKTYK